MRFDASINLNLGASVSWVWRAYRRFERQLEFLWIQDMYKLSFDPDKRQKALVERNVDFAEAWQVFEGRVIEWEDTRFDYGENRIMCFGYLRGRAVVVGYVQRGDTRHIFSMRKANEREREKFG